MDKATYERECNKRRSEHEAARAKTLSDAQLADAIVEAKEIENWRQLNVLEEEFESRWGSGN